MYSSSYSYPQPTGYPTNSPPPQQPQAHHLSYQQQPQQAYGTAGGAGYNNNAPYQTPVAAPNYGSPPTMDSHGGYPQSSTATYGQGQGVYGQGYEAYAQGQGQGQSGYPQAQGGYGQPQQPAYGAPQQPAYGGTQQPAYGAPQQPAYGGTQQPAYGAPQQPAYGGTQQPAYGAPAPQGVYGVPPHQPVAAYGAPQQPAAYGAPIPSFNTSTPYFLGIPIPAPPPAPPLSLPSYQPSTDVDKLRKATKGFGTDEKAIIDVLTRVDSMQVDVLSRTFEQMVGKSLKKVLEKELSGWLENGLVLCSMGPLNSDVHLLHRAMSGAGTHEDLLNELLLGRTNLEIHLLKEGYQRTFGKDLVRTVQGELSMKTERMFNMALSGARDENPQVNHSLVQTDIAALHKAGAGQMGTDEIAICGILLQRSNEHLRDLAMAYQSRYKRTLSQAIASEFSGHMRDALMYIARGAEADGQGIQRDADMLEAAMAGAGTKDERLTWRIVRGHWNRPRFEAVKQAYQRTYGKPLKKRVEGETTGKFERLLVALIQ